MPQQSLDPAAHLGRRLVGEGHGQNAVRRSALDFDQPGDPMHQHARLAAAGAGQNQRGAERRGHRLALRVVQPVEQVRNIHRGADCTVERRRAKPRGAPGAMLRRASRSRARSARSLRRCRLLGKFDQGEHQGQHHRTDDDADGAERGNPAENADEDRECGNSRPSRDQERPQYAFEAAQHQAPGEHEDGETPVALREEPSHRRDPDDGRAADRKHRQERRQRRRIRRAREARRSRNRCPPARLA